MSKKCPVCGIKLDKENYDFSVVQSPSEDRLLVIYECKECKFSWIEEGEYKQGYDVDG